MLKCTADAKNKFQLCTITITKMLEIMLNFVCVAIVISFIKHPIILISLVRQAGQQIPESCSLLVEQAWRREGISPWRQGE